MELIYRRSSDAYLCERRLQRYARLGAGIISYEVDANDNEITKWSDGRMEVECKLLAVSRAITTAYQEGYYANESWTLPTGFTAVSWADCKYISAARIVNASVKSLSTSTIEFYMLDLAGSATVTVDVLLKAVGRWK
jgi:hypothetical protein